MLSRPAMHMVISNFGHLFTFYSFNLWKIKRYYETILPELCLYDTKIIKLEFYLPTLIKNLYSQSIQCCDQILECWFFVVSNHQKRCVEKKNMKTLLSWNGSWDQVFKYCRRFSFLYMSARIYTIHDCEGKHNLISGLSLLKLDPITFNNSIIKVRCI